MDLIIVRHGATDDNSRGVVRNSPDGTLSTLGRQQARDLAIKLKHEPIAAMYSSDYQRCVETARLLHTNHQNIPIEFTSDLQEMHGGGMMDKMGFPPRLVVNGIQLLKLLHAKTPGGESWTELCARVGNFLNQTYEKHPNHTIVLVTHGITMQGICTLLEDNRSRKSKLKEVPNCTSWRMKMEKRIADLK